MEVKLVVVGGKTNKGTVALKLPAVVGRSREAALTVAHPMISRQHCEIFEVDGLLMIRDLGSLNGTVVQGRRVSESPLRPDDEFSIGPLSFRAVYQYDGDLDAMPAAKILPQQEDEPGEEVPRFEAVEDVTPYDPQAFAGPAGEPLPDFLAAQADEGRTPEQELADFAAWAETHVQSEAGSPVAEEPVAELEDVVVDEEEEEPEPTPQPPPRRPKPAVRQGAAEAVREQPAIEAEQVEKEAAQPEPLPPATPAEPVAEPTDAAPAESEDDDLKRFLKGLP